MRICIIGCGGIGTHLIPLMVDLTRNNEDVSITVMDGDVFEPKNLDRQRFDGRYIGANKADAMGEMYDINSDPNWLVEADQLNMYHFIICVPDNRKARLLALEASQVFEVPCITAGNEARSANACYYHPNQVPYAYPPNRYKEMLEPEEVRVGSCHEQAESAPQTALANSFAASMALGLFMYWTESAPQLPPDIMNVFAPVEFIWTPSACKTIKTGELNGH